MKYRLLSNHAYIVGTPLWESLTAKLQLIDMHRSEETDDIFIDEADGLDGRWSISMRFLGMQTLLGMFRKNRESYFRDSTDFDDITGRRTRVNADGYTRSEAEAVDDW